MIIDASNQVLGRVCTFVAKKALIGEDVKVINCEKAVITGDKRNVIGKYKTKMARGQPKQGPYIQRTPDRFVRRIIRGMLPYKQEKGEKAYSRVKCFVTVPESLKDQKAEKVKGAEVSKLPNLKYVKVGDLCQELGK
ncbi:MAG: 50S ribosomal protein L13 [bacterium]|nr:50S ribosomal protein L13 [bacterium]